MNAQELITEHLDIWTTAQEQKKSGGRGRGKKKNDQSLYGIKKLRELILDLAVRGKLVEQNPEDEPASVLLEKIAEEKARLIKEGKIKKQKKLPEISEEEKPFTLPNGWCFARLGEITARIGSGSTPRGGKSAYVESGIPFLRSQNIWNHGLELRDVANISDKTHAKMSNTVVCPCDILLNITGASLGRCTIYPDGLGEANVSQHVSIIRPIDENTTNYLHLCILSPHIQKFIWGRQVGMAREGLSKKVLELFEMPFPPLPEQHRIVAKVDELMALCDQLEQQQTTSNATHQTLLQTLLTTLTKSADHQASTTTWEQIATHFDLLFTTEQSIDQLKQTILQLAVMGKLVPQNPEDEPASVLLEKIAKEKAHLIKEGKIKKQKKLPEIAEEEKPFVLPDGWEWAKLDDLALKSEAGWSPKCKATPREGNTWGVLKVSAITWGVFKYYENKELPEHLTPRPQYEVMPGDFLISRANTANLVARAVVVPADTPIHLMMSDKIIRIIFSSFVNIEFISLVNSSPASRSYYARVAGGTSDSMKNVSRNKIRALTIPLPPLTEQHRIVAKVDELMTLCDQLKTRLHENQTTKLQLADTIVKQVVV